MNLVELRESRAKFIADARGIINTADGEGRDLTAEENERSDKLFDEADKLEAKILTAEKRDAVEAAEARLKAAPPVAAVRNRLSTVERPNYGEGLRSWLLKGHRQVTAESVENMARCGLSYDSNEATLEKRDLQKGTLPGSALVGWSEFYNGFFEEVKSYGPILNYIRYLDTMTGNPLPMSVADDTGNMATILAETATTKLADPTFSNVSMGAYKYESGEVIISLEELADASIDLETYIPRILAERFGRGWAYHATVGTGSGQPFGVVTRASASGVVAGGTAAAPTLTADQFLDLADSVDDAYRSDKCVYMAHPSTIAKLRKLKDNNGQFLFLTGLQAGVSSTFCGYPIVRNQNMAVSGANAKLVVFGDLSRYIWRRAMGVQIYRLNEYRIRQGQISFLAFARADGNLVQPNAVKALLAPAS